MRARCAVGDVRAAIGRPDGPGFEADDWDVDDCNWRSNAGPFSTARAPRVLPICFHMLAIAFEHNHPPVGTPGTAAPRLGYPEG
ncbi:hypothetical protein JCM9803A_11140 [Rhodococcus erythropolis]